MRMPNLQPVVSILLLGYLIMNYKEMCGFVSQLWVSYKLLAVP